MLTVNVSRKSRSIRSTIGAFFLTALFIMVLVPGFGGGGRRASAAGGACTGSADQAFEACENEALDDYHIALGNCANLSDPAEAEQCLATAEEERDEALDLCPDQRDARYDICDVLGEDPYDPPINPESFVNPLKIGHQVKPNPYFPLVPGTVWKYLVRDSEGEIVEKIKVEVLKKTKEILGVTCIVVHDRVWEIDEEGNKTLIEDTDDWYAQDLAGNVWYFGEISQEFEDGELIGLEGSWKAGRDYAKPGYLMQADPTPGTLYRQEFALGDAEDMAEVEGFVDSLVVKGKIYHNVLQTGEFTPIEPDVLEYKYYAPGVGVVKEENPDTGEIVILVKKKVPHHHHRDNDDNDNDDDDHDDKKGKKRY
jgi:hypothetical protein